MASPERTRNSDPQFRGCRPYRSNVRTHVSHVSPLSFQCTYTRITCVALIVPMYVHTYHMRHAIKGHRCPHSRTVLHIMTSCTRRFQKDPSLISCVDGMCVDCGFISALPLTIHIYFGVNIIASPLCHQAYYGRCCLHGLLPIRQLRYTGRV